MLCAQDPGERCRSENQRQMAGPAALVDKLVAIPQGKGSAVMNTACWPAMSVLTSLLLACRRMGTGKGE